MTTKTSARARVREDRAGEPLDGLVNLFDLGIVLAIAFLLVGLSSLKLSGALGQAPKNTKQPNVTVNQNQSVHNVTLRPGQRVIGEGKPVGTVYRLSNGQLVYVTPGPTTPPGR